MNSISLIQKTIEIKKKAYAPFSCFKVGALLITKENRQFSGCNIEISSYGLTICAERVAIFKAVSEGEREFKEIYIATDTEQFCPPCGACRQVLWELAGNIKVIMINNRSQSKTGMLQHLLPEAFDKKYFEEI